ncbi:PucR family transcriptional regulator [Phytoactinopolyspora limicola]|uniref:PucR family transcriptional regulator n=1 Tax=Phytoactinopolyspora limicola TaxID=2715536 RepID=UPI00140991BA|nr:helix-turn-helix domain-containing protein [Phytoactinopolyspora limicola]
MTVLVHDDVEPVGTRRPQFTVVGATEQHHSPATHLAEEASGLDVTVRQLLADDWIPQVEVLSAPMGIDRPIRRVMIWDAGTTAVAAGDLVLAVGVDATASAMADMVTAAGRSGAIAVLVKGPAQTSWLRPHADRSGVAVLAVPPSYSWDWIHQRTRGMLATSAVECGPDAPGDALFVLANAAAADLGAPVEIDDAALRVLAFSSLGHQLDELRTASILNRGVPPWAQQWLRAEGLDQRLRATYQPLSVEPPDSARRLVAPIRVGIEILGYVWVAETAEPFPPDAELTVERVARQAAAVMVRGQSAAGTDGRVRASLLGGVLDGADLVEALVTSLAAPRTSLFRLIGFEVTPRDTPEPVDVRCLVGVALMRAEALGSRCAGTTVGGRTYLLVDVAGISERALWALAAEIVERAGNQLGLDVVAAIGDLVGDLRCLPDARRTVDCMLGVIVSAPETRVCHADDLRPQVVLSELRDVVRDRPHLLNGRLSVLAELDRTQNTEYMATLRAYFDASCDRARAAQMLFVHRNTLRYRLQRIREICGLDLDNPVERLVAELQVRLG